MYLQLLNFYHLVTYQAQGRTLLTIYVVFSSINKILQFCHILNCISVKQSILWWPFVGYPPSFSIQSWRNWQMYS